ncbi:hypothetical protein LLE49_07760 [Alicyclobacillus tolerans]|nr:hypothetical protein [Alicyclobacillus tolerans]
MPVLVMRDRTACTNSLVMPSMKTEEIARPMLPVLSQDTVLCTDAYHEYKTVTKSAGIQHIALNQNRGEFKGRVSHPKRQCLSQSSKGLVTTLSRCYNVVPG